MAIKKKTKAPREDDEEAGGVLVTVSDEEDEAPSEKPAVDDEDDEPDPPKPEKGRKKKEKIKKPKVATAHVDPTDKELASLETSLEAKYGKGCVVTASEGQALDIDRIPTGILALDFTMGGGLPKGRVTMFFGDESGGKSTIALLCLAAFQRHTKKLTGEVAWALWADAEGAWDNEWARQMGVDTSRVKVVRMESAQDTLDVCRILLGTGKFKLFVLDSIAALTPEEELAGSMSQSLPGLQARLTNKFIRDIVSKLTKTGATSTDQLTVLLINQVREKIGVIFGNPETTPGGKGCRFATSIEIRFGRGDYDYLDEHGLPLPGNKKAPEGQAPSRVNLKWRSTKNKCGPPRVVSGCTLYLQDVMPLGIKTGYVDEIDRMWQYGQKEGLIKKEDGVWRCGNLRAGSKPELKVALEKDFDAQDALKTALLKCMLK